MQVGRQRAGPRTGEQQIAPVLKIQRQKPRIFAARLHGGEALIGRRGRAVLAAEVQIHAPEKPPVLGDVRLPDTCIGFGRDIGEPAPAAFGGVVALEIRIMQAIIRAGGEEQRDRVGAFHAQAFRRGAHPSALGASFEAAFENYPNASGLPAQHDAVARTLRLRGRFPLERDGERRPARLIRRNSHNHRLGWGRGEDLARVPHAVHAVFGAGDSGIEVEFAPVVLGRAAVAKIQEQIGERLIRRPPGLPRRVPGAAEFVGLRELAVEQQRAHLGDDVARFGAVLFRVMAGPHAMLVELKALVLYAAKHHGADAAISHGQRFGPDLGRFAIPEGQRVGVGGSGGGPLRAGGQHSQRHSGALEQFTSSGLSHWTPANLPWYAHCAGPGGPSPDAARYIIGVGRNARLSPKPRGV